jgi:predicted alpha/beta-fold hydrolase
VLAVSALAAALWLFWPQTPLAETSTYAAPRWLPGGHAQTIYAAVVLPRAVHPYRRERWETPDGDFIDLDWVAGEPGDARRPLVVMFHGLEGSSRSHYALALMKRVAKQGMRGVVVNFRGCSGEPNLLARAYHSGDAQEIDWILRRLRSRNADAPLYAVGVSLGGNALLKWLGESGPAASGVIAAAAAVSAPLDLMAAGDALGRGFNLIYTRNFLSSLKTKSVAKLARFPDLFDAKAVQAAATLREFDNLVTAPLHGFRDTDDYWTRASSKPGLNSIRVPTLVINARNDPFLPAAALPRPDEVSAAVVLEQPDEGGHVGFVGGPFPGNYDWLPGRVLRFLTQQR